jgi:transposase
MEAKRMASTESGSMVVTLGKADRRRLDALAVDVGASERMRARARIVLAAADGASNAEIAEQVGVDLVTVRKWRRRFVAEGFAGLGHRPPESGKVRGRPAPALELDDEAREVLERWVRRSTISAGLAQRARIVLEAATGATNVEVAERVGCGPNTVGKWRRRFAEGGLVALSDEYRPGRPRTIGDEAVEALIIKTLEGPQSEDATHWSTRSMAQAAGVSQSSVSRIWRAFGLQPHRVSTFKLSTDPNFIDKLHDVVGLYLNPPERAVVICVDEKTGIQALDRTQLALPMLPGSPTTRSHDYVRHGTVDLFAALNVGTGEVITHTDRRHRSIEFRKFLDQVADEIPDGLDVHVILDNASTHKTPAIRRWLQQHPHWEFHFTPTSSSWLNLIERWFSELTTKNLQRSTHTSVRDLANDIIAWAESWNANPRPYVWRKTADDILNSMRKYLQRINDSRH